MKRLAILAPFALIAACNEAPAGEPVVTVNLKPENGAAAAADPAPGPTPAADAQSARASACASAIFEQVELTHCLADPARHTIDVVYGPGDGSTAYGTLGAFAATVDAASIAFAMNGGAFRDDLTPKGYLVASGERLSE